jgi:hypothetical protein
MFLLLLCRLTALAQDNPEAGTSDAVSTPAADASSGSAIPSAPTPQAHPAAVTYSHGYEVRLKIHKYASYATLPLFATEFALGQSLYNDPTRDNRRGVHAAVGAGIVGLFAANSVTGVWNLWEGRHDPNATKVRTIHSILMLAANGGFVAAAMTAPNTHRGTLVVSGDKATHRDIAVASIGVGSVGYLLMLFKGK